MNNSRRITEGALMTGVYLLLLLVIIFLPIAGALLMLALPVPFIFYSYRHGGKAGALMLVATLIFTVVFATVFSLPATLLAGVGGLFLGAALHKNRSAYETWAQGSIGFIIGLLGVYLSTQLFFGVNWTEEIRNSLNEGFTMTENLLGGLMSSEQSELQLEAVREQVNTLPDIIPSVLVISGIIIAFISQWISFKVINRVEKKKLRFPPFREFKLPTSLLWYYLIAMVLMLIVGEEGTLYLAAINIFTLTGLLIVLQGFSFIFYYADKKKWSKAIPILLIVFSFLLPQILLYLVRILGIIDLGFSLRERVQEKK
ncbi:DUF2232 domain-containing protein [Halobacillus fulvus]|nr:DUF2232 domain-containing protein [Halobacillus fulvus]